MNKRVLCTGISLLLVAGCASAPRWQWAGLEPLSPCGIEGGPFEDTKLRDWPETYHSTVSRIVEAHLIKLQEPSSTDIKCTAGDYASMMKANSALQGLASKLEPWKESQVSELEVGPVLLEYLRVYECALEEKRYFITGAQHSSASSSSAPSIAYGKYIEEEADDSTLIEREMATARPILERTLSLMGGLDRLNLLKLEIECLRRSSLDLRNVLGLAAEASACMPRSWDVRGSLRDMPAPPPEE